MQSIHKILPAIFLLLLPLASHAGESLLTDGSEEERKLELLEQNDNPPSDSAQNTTENKNFIPSAGEKPAPSKRLTVGAARGEHVGIELSIYVPEDHLVDSSQPKLKWELSDAVNKPIKFMLVSDDQDEPVYEKTLGQTFAKGLQVIDLKNHDVTLENNKEYQWSMQVCETDRCEYGSSALINRAVFSYLSSSTSPRNY